MPLTAAQINALPEDVRKELLSLREAAKNAEHARDDAIAAAKKAEKSMDAMKQELEEYRTYWRNMQSLLKEADAYRLGGRNLFHVPSSLDAQAMLGFFDNLICEYAAKSKENYSLKTARYTTNQGSHAFPNKAARQPGAESGNGGDELVDIIVVPDEAAGTPAPVSDEAAINGEDIGACGAEADAAPDAADSKADADGGGSQKNQPGNNDGQPKESSADSGTKSSGDDSSGKQKSKNKKKISPEEQANREIKSSTTSLRKLIRHFCGQDADGLEQGIDEIRGCLLNLANQTQEGELGGAGSKTDALFDMSQLESTINRLAPGREVPLNDAAVIAGLTMDDKVLVPEEFLNFNAKEHLCGNCRGPAKFSLLKGWTRFTVCKHVPRLVMTDVIKCVIVAKCHKCMTTQSFTAVNSDKIIEIPIRELVNGDEALLAKIKRHSINENAGQKEPADGSSGQEPANPLQPGQEPHEDAPAAEHGRDAGGDNPDGTPNQEILDKVRRIVNSRPNLYTYMPRDFGIDTESKVPIFNRCSDSIGTFVSLVVSTTYQYGSKSRSIERYIPYGLSHGRGIDLTIGAARAYLHPMAKAILHYILNCHVVHCDETRVQCLSFNQSGQCNQYGQVWSVTSANTSPDKLCYTAFVILPARSEAEARNVLGILRHKSLDPHKKQEIIDAIAEQERTEAEKQMDAVRRVLLDVGTTSYDIVVTDRLASYDKVLDGTSAEHALCFAHPRRYVAEDLLSCAKDAVDIYQEILKTHGYGRLCGELYKAYKDKRLGDEAYLMLVLFYLITTLFHLESMVSNKDSGYLAKIRKIRETYSSVVFEQMVKVLLLLVFKCHAATIKERPDGSLSIIPNKKRPLSSRIVKYMLSDLDGFGRFLCDPEIPLSNNIQELAFRSTFTRFRALSMFAKSIDGSAATAAMWTIVYSCRLVGVDPECYLIWLIRNLQKRYQQNYVRGRPMSEQSPMDQPRVKKIPEDKKKGQKKKRIGVFEQDLHYDEVSMEGLFPHDYRRMLLKQYHMEPED